MLSILPLVVYCLYLLTLDLAHLAGEYYHSLVLFARARTEIGLVFLQISPARAPFYSTQTLISINCT